MPLGFDKKFAVFTNSRGTQIARATVRNAAIDLATATSGQLRQLTATALGTQMEAADFRDKFAAILKTAHIQSGMVGRGGKGNMSPSAYGKLGSIVKKQYAFLDGFTQDLIDGKLTDKQAISRAAQYGSAIMESYGEMEKLSIIDSELTWGRRSLSTTAKHCADCIELATYPYYRSVLSLVPIGSGCKCRGNCKCRIDYDINPPLRLRLGKG